MACLYNRVNHGLGPRERDVLASPDLEKIPKAPQAGVIVGNDQIMHNGIKVAVGTYYAESMHRRFFAVTQGVHEPQEEYVFQEVLKVMEPGSTMLELGAHWGFYSLWFQKEVARARTILVEPEMTYLNSGRLNFAINGYEGTFIHGYVSRKPWLNPTNAATLTVDGIAESLGIDRIHILHSDIQGGEHEMLQGAKGLIDKRCIDYLFISTHSSLLHEDCKQFLLGHDYFIVAEHTLRESYSVDGLIVARRSELKGIGPVAVAKKDSL